MEKKKQYRESDKKTYVFFNIINSFCRKYFNISNIFYLNVARMNDTYRQYRMPFINRWSGSKIITKKINTEEVINNTL